MPRPGSVPQPEFASTGTYGEAASANRLQDALFGMPDEDVDEEDFQPADDAEAFLAAPTFFPEQPVSAGAPFGPGADFVAPRQLTPAEVLVRQARSLEQSPLAGNREVRAFIDRVRRGL